MSDTELLSGLRERARLLPKGNRFEDMTEGRVFDHHWGRTITAGDNAAFTTQTLSFCPLYFNEPYAQSLGHPNILVNPLLVFNTVFGLSVEDLSEGGGPFLGVDDCHFHRTGLHRRYPHRPQHGDRRAGVQRPERVRHRHLADGRFQTVWRQSDLLSTHESGSPPIFGTN